VGNPRTGHSHTPCRSMPKSYPPRVPCAFRDVNQSHKPSSQSHLQRSASTAHPTGALRRTKGHGPVHANTYLDPNLQVEEFRHAQPPPSMDSAMARNPARTPCLRWENEKIRASVRFTALETQRMPPILPYFCTIEISYTMEKNSFPKWQYSTKSANNSRGRHDRTGASSPRVSFPGTLPTRLHIALDLVW